MLVSKEVTAAKEKAYETRAEPKQNESRTKEEALVQILVQIGSSRDLKLNRFSLRIRKYAMF